MHHASHFSAQYFSKYAKPHALQTKKVLDATRFSSIDYVFLFNNLKTDRGKAESVDAKKADWNSTHPDVGSGRAQQATPSKRVLLDPPNPFTSSPCFRTHQ